MSACPVQDGWNVAHQDEWLTLFNVAGGILTAGGALKEKDTLHWKAPNTGATNTFNFTALPGGRLDDTLSFVNQRISSHFWSLPNTVFKFSFDNSLAVTEHNVLNQANSVRCVKKLDQY
jgi:uncharacterized protein (TIGR02145 family)